MGLLLFQVAHLVLDEAAASSLLRRFIACRSSLLRDILEGSGAASPGHKKTSQLLDAVGWLLQFFLNHVILWYDEKYMYCMHAYARRRRRVGVNIRTHTHTRDRQL